MEADHGEGIEMLETAMKAANKAEDAVGTKAIVLALKAVVFELTEIKVEIRKLKGD